MSDLPFLGKVALVTGGAARLGKHIALMLAAHGADIALHYHSSTADASQTRQEILSLGRSCELFQADLEAPDACERLFKSINGRMMPVEILINSAGIFPQATFQETTLELWDHVFSTNLRAPFFLCQSFASQTDTGSIVNLADWRGERIDLDNIAYSLSKNGLIEMTKALAIALAPHIRVNGIAPGAILPPPGKTLEDLKPSLDCIPLRIFGSPEDVSKTVLFLLTSPFLTGEIVQVTGGQHLA